MINQTGTLTVPEPVPQELFDTFLLPATAPGTGTCVLYIDRCVDLRVVGLILVVSRSMVVDQEAEGERTSKAGRKLQRKVSINSEISAGGWEVVVDRRAGGGGKPERYVDMPGCLAPFVRKDPACNIKR